jgi:hypothetical protein
MATRGYDGPSGLGPPDGSGAFQNLRELDSAHLPREGRGAPRAFGLRAEEERP